MSLRTAIETGDLAELPSRRDEDWRWTDLRGLVRTLPPRSPTNVGPFAPGLFDGLADEVVIVSNGELRTSITLARGEEQVVAVRFIAAADAGAHAAPPRMEVSKGRLVILETYEGLGSGYLSEIDFTLSVKTGGSIERIVLTDEPEDAVSVVRCDVTLEPGASFAQTVIAAGARRQRLETHVAHPGGGASVRLDGVYLLDGRRHADITTVVTHAGVDGTTDQLVKGVVKDQARAVFQGRIIVAHGADKTDARMGHHALVLDDRAEVDAKPELEIYADDVSCAHGNTVGALDEEALFYAEQRGIPHAEARALLTEAFVGEVVDRIEHAGAREIVRAWVAGRLGAAQ
ncbi:Fe-S cluster assembly protein SufD [Caulobacter sp. KR2-114]|uniref:Fe-S cluster assembly protein SufD n=1 Tax=Caulobacter sp. KR2-114 TaxID=3400912 RepID=UPI003C088183